MTNNNEKYIEKIKKLLALAKSTNPNEAAIAMNQTIKLMAKHNISNNDVRLSEIEEHITKSVLSNTNKPSKYFPMLIKMISLAFGCHAYLTVVNKRKVSFYGFKERPEQAAYAFDVLSSQLVKARDNKKCNGSESAQFIGYYQGKDAQLNHGVAGSGYSPLKIGRDLDEI